MDIKLDPKVFNDTYLPMLFDYSYRYECYYGGAGSGKSHFIWQKMVVKGLQSKRKFLIVRKVGNTHRDSTFQMLKDTLQFFKIYDQCKVNKTDMTIEFMNGTIFIFKGMDDSEKIKSVANITDIFYEEVTEGTLEDVSQLDLRLRAKADNLQMFFAFNPVSKDNFVYKYFHRDNPESTPTNMYVLKTTYKDNKFLPQSYVDSLEQMKDSNPVYYKIYVEGEFASLDKLIFPNVEVKEMDKDEVGGVLCCGLDFGYTNDPTAFTAFMLNQEKRVIYVFDEFYEYNMTNNMIAGKIIEKGYYKAKIKADRQEKKSIDELKRDYNISRITGCNKGKGSVLQGIQYLQQFKIYVHPSCENHISEFRNYSWLKSKQTGEYTNDPIDKFNHLMDAMRYASQIVRGGKVKTMNKAVLGL